MSSRKLSFTGLTSTINSLPLSLRPRKKLHFYVTFTLQELINCTLLTGVLYAKIQLKDGGNFSEASHRNDVENHRVIWDQDFNFTCKMYVNATTGVLEPAWCKISLRKESKGGRSFTKLGFVKINLAEYAGAGTKPGKYLLQSYNENKHKLDNSVLKVKVYLRQTSGDIVFKAPDTRGFDIPQMVTGEEDEGFQDDWLSNLYGRGHRASTGSTMSSHSTGTNITWSSHSSSAGNLKASTSDISKEPSLLFLEKGGAESEVRGAVGGALEETVGVAMGGVSRGDESGSEETVVEQCPSQITVGTLQTASSKNKSESESSVSSSNETTPPPITEIIPPTPTNEEDSKSERLTNSFRDLRHSPGLRKQEREGSPLGLLPPPMRRPKLGPSVQGSRITASFSSGSHRRQASMGGGGPNPQTPSPLVLGNHKRHSSVSVLSQREYLQDATSLSSNKTRISVLSTLEQSRVDTESLVNQLIANHDLTPASDDEGQSNLKLYVDRHSGGVTLAGHDLDRSRFKEIHVHDEESIHRPPRRHKTLASSGPLKKDKTPSPPISKLTSNYTSSSSHKSN